MSNDSPRNAEIRISNDQAGPAAAVSRSRKSSLLRIRPSAFVGGSLVGNGTLVIENAARGGRTALVPYTIRTLCLLFQITRGGLQGHGFRWVSASSSLSCCF